VSNRRCCAVAAGDSQRETIAAAAGGSNSQPGPARRYLNRARWIVPSVILALLPKCPACLAAYIAIGTGLGLSVTAAAYVRMVLLITCAASLSYLVVTRLRPFRAMFTNRVVRRIA
jgi:hypothetical protein